MCHLVFTEQMKEFRVNVNWMTEAHVASIVDNQFISGDVLSYFLEYFAERAKNKLVHLVNPLYMASLFYDRGSAVPTKVDFKRLQRKNQCLLHENFSLKGERCWHR